MIAIGMKTKLKDNRHLDLLRMETKMDHRGDLPQDYTNLNRSLDHPTLRTHRCTRTVPQEVYLVTCFCNHHNQDIQGDYRCHYHKEKSFMDSLMVVIYLRSLLLFHYYIVKDLLRLIHQHILQLL